MVTVVGAVTWNITIPERPVAVIVSAELMSCDVPYPNSPRAVVDRTATVPKDFHPVAAVMCDSFLGEDVAADRTVVFGEERWEGDFSTVVDLLNRSSEHKTWFPDSCDSDYSLAVLPEFWLLDNEGRAVRPGYPVNSCGRAKPGALGAISDLTPAGRTEHRVPLSDSDIEFEWGCSPIYAEPLVGPASAPALNPNSRYCRFESGRFVGTSHSEYDSSTVPVWEALADLPTARACNMPANSVAVTTFSTIDYSNPRLTIELDGCRRVIPDGYAPLQATEQLLAAFW